MSTLSKELDLETIEGEQEVRLAHRYRSKNEMITVKAVGIETLTLGTSKQQALKVYYKGIYGYIPKNLMDEYEYRSLQSFTRGTFDILVDDVFTGEDQSLLFLGNRKEALAYQANKYWAVAKPGDIITAYVSGVDQFNVWLLVNGIRVLMGRDDYSYKFPRDLQLEVFLGDSFDVKVTEVDAATKTLKVSKKLLEANPLDYLKDYRVGGTYISTVENIDLDYGVFVSLEPRGLTARSGFPPIETARLLKVGEQVNFKITRIDEEAGKVGGLIIVPRQGQLNRAFRNRR